MAKKEPKKAKEKKPKKGAAATPPAGATSAPGVPPTTAAPGGVPSTGVPSGGIPPTGTPSVPLSQMMPDQMSQQQLEQAIKDSNDPESRLKKLHSPLSVKGCLLNLLFLVILTIGIVILWCYLTVDKFDFVTVVKHMSSEFGITQGFEWLGAQIKSWFGG